MWSNDRTINVATVAAFLFFIIWLPMEIWQPQWFPIEPLALLAIAAGGAVIVLTRAWLWQVGLVGGHDVEPEPFIRRGGKFDRRSYRLPNWNAPVLAIAPSTEEAVAERVALNQHKHGLPPSLSDMCRQEGGVQWLSRRLWPRVDRRTIN